VASDNIRGILLQTARHDFPAFYAAAPAREVQLMDMLVLLTALFVRLNDPEHRNATRAGWAEEERTATRQMFDELRKSILDGRTFNKIPSLEQQKIQRVIFDRVA
jgi:hypothetical protein